MDGNDLRVVDIRCARCDRPIEGCIGKHGDWVHVASRREHCDDGQLATPVRVRVVASRSKSVDGLVEHVCSVCRALFRGTPKARTCQNRGCQLVARRRRDAAARERVAS